MHYTQLSFDDQTKMFISVTPLMIPLQKFQYAHWLRTRQCFSNNAKRLKKFQDKNTQQSRVSVRLPIKSMKKY